MGSSPVGGFFDAGGVFAVVLIGGFINFFSDGNHRGGLHCIHFHQKYFFFTFFRVHQAVASLSPELWHFFVSAPPLQMSVKVRAVAPTSSDQMFRALEVQTKLRSRFEHSSGRTMYRSEIRVGVHQVARQSGFGHNHSIFTILEVSRFTI